MAPITLEANDGPVTMDAVCISRNVERHGKTAAGLLTTVTEIWREDNGQCWEYTKSFVQPPMTPIGGYQ